MRPATEHLGDEPYTLQSPTLLRQETGLKTKEEEEEVVFVLLLISIIIVLYLFGDVNSSKNNNEMLSPKSLINFERILDQGHE